MNKILLVFAAILLSSCSSIHSRNDDAMNDKIKELEEKTAKLEEQNKKLQQEQVALEPEGGKQPSNAMMKAKCLELGRADSSFNDRTTENDWIHYDFFYSPVLDTCVVEKMMDRLVADDVGSWYVLFDMLAPEGPSREIISWYSWCTDGYNPAYPEQECATKADYDAKKNKILPNY